MNNNFLQTLQLLQQQQQQMGQQPQMQGSGVDMPHIPNAPLRQYNPVTKGASDAMHSARQSLEMDDNQRTRAMGVYLMNLAANMQVPQHEGFSGMLGSVNQAMHPAAQAYLTEQNNYRKMNQNEAYHREALERQKHQDDYQMMQLARQLSHDEAMLEEKRAYHKQKLKGSGNHELPPGANLSGMPRIKSARDESKLSERLQASKDALESFAVINENMEALEKETKDNKFKPFGKKSALFNPMKDFAADVLDVDSLKNETLIRKNLESEFNRIEPLLEKSLKGGTPDAQLIKRFHNAKVYFNSGERLDVVKSRIEEINKEVEKRYELDEFNKKYGVLAKKLPSWYKREEGNSNEDEIIDSYIKKYPELEGQPREDIRKVLMEEGKL